MFGGPKLLVLNVLVIDNNKFMWMVVEHHCRGLGMRTILQAESVNKALDILGDNPVLENLLVAVDVGDERIDGPDPLLEATLHELPFGLLDYPRNEVEGKDPLGALIVSVHVEGHPLVPIAPSNIQKPPSQHHRSQSSLELYLDSGAKRQVNIVA